MRIRTIKPEFWTHPVMMRLSDESKLLALALLNYADDEGFFFADPDVMRGALFPLKDSTIIRRSIDDLSRIGYLDIREHPTHGPVGLVTGFTKHQRVDRAKDSQIKQFWGSTNNRRLIDDESTLEQGTGNRERGTCEIPPLTPQGGKAKKPRLKFQKPTPEEVDEYGFTLNPRFTRGREFCDFYESKGWLVGKSPMKDWKATVRTWQSRQATEQAKARSYGVGHTTSGPRNYLG